MAECPSVCEHLHLPIQSGDDAMLQRMGRQYTVAHYRERLDRIRAAVPGIAVSTDVIVGFCGETEEQFEATLRVLDEIRFDTVFAAAYSPRPGTPALRMADDVPAAVKRRRLNDLLARQERIGLELNRAWLGRQVEVLVERVTPPRRVASVDDPADADDRGGGRGVPALAGTAGEGSVALAGRTRHNKLVHFAGRPLARRADRRRPHRLRRPVRAARARRRLSSRVTAPAAPPPLVVLAGATATGKTALSLALAEALRARGVSAEIVSADSRQVYRGMDIGTAKATPEERARVPHHGLDLVDPDQAFSVADYSHHAARALAGIAERGAVALLVGGTGFYLRAVARGLAVDELPWDAGVRAGIEATSRPRACPRSWRSCVASRRPVPRRLISATHAAW